MILKRDHDQIVEDFKLRRARQVVAIAAALLLIVLLALIHRFDLIGNLARDTTFGIQVMVIAAFIGFTYANWRCPSCKQYLGKDINKHGCGKCGIRFQ